MKALVAVNAAWVVGSVALLLANLPISAFGWSFVIAQALVVGVIAELQWTGLRRAERGLSPA